MYLGHMDGEPYLVCQRLNSLFLRGFQVGLTSCGIQAATASLTLEMFRFLMIDQDLQIIEIAFAIVTPWSCKLFFNVRMTSLFLTHDLNLKVYSLRKRAIGKSRLEK